MKTNPQKTAVNQAPVVKATLNNVVDTIFGTAPIKCQFHKMENEMVVVMMGSGACVTLHVQEIDEAIKKGGKS